MWIECTEDDGVVFDNEKVITTFKKGYQLGTPDSNSIFYGTLEEFKVQFPNISTENVNFETEENILKND